MIGIGDSINGNKAAGGVADHSLPPSAENNKGGPVSSPLMSSWHGD
jgi:hypothetical protein